MTAAGNHDGTDSSGSEANAIYSIKILTMWRNKQFLQIAHQREQKPKSLVTILLTEWEQQKPASVAMKPKQKKKGQQ